VADYWLLPPVTGERFLLCSDGLTNEVTDDQIVAELAAAAVPEETAQRLVDQALAAGGHDNVTVLVVDVTETTTGTEVDEDTVPRAAAVAEPVDGVQA
jgi:protein phosphatase